jgi:hypothetical protein
MPTYYKYFCVYACVLIKNQKWCNLIYMLRYLNVHHYPEFEKLYEAVAECSPVRPPVPSPHINLVSRIKVPEELPLSSMGLPVLTVVCGLEIVKVQGDEYTVGYPLGSPELNAEAQHYGHTGGAVLYLATFASAGKKRKFSEAGILECLQGATDDLGITELLFDRVTNVDRNRTPIPGCDSPESGRPQTKPKTMTHSPFADLGEMMTRE